MRAPSTTRRAHVDAPAVREFYDQFLVTRMVKYRVHGNIRIDRAVDRLAAYLSPTHRILEIGCGIGMVTERLARLVPRGHVWGCDISPRNIDFARSTVRADNVTFFVCDVLQDVANLQSVVEGEVDVVALIDVIEHLPLSSHQTLFTALAPLIGPNSFVVLTFPSPQYQSYLQQERPGELQIVDEVVELTHLIDAAAAGGLVLCHFSLEDVWLRNQYVHCVFQASDSIEPMAITRPSLGKRLAYRALRYVRHRRVARTLKRIKSDWDGQS